MKRCDNEKLEGKGPEAQEFLAREGQEEILCAWRGRWRQALMALGRNLEFVLEWKGGPQWVSSRGKSRPD